jgi:hypothetical protein
MSEILLRGWNVAVPVVDVGDDVFVIDDNDKTTLRVQVKSSSLQTDRMTGVRSASFNLSRKQLRADLLVKLLYMFMIRDEENAKWSFLVMPRDRLDNIHRRYLDPNPTRRGRPPKTDDEAETDKLNIEISLSDEGPRTWGVSLQEFFECWPEILPPSRSGPGSARK